MSTTQKTTGNYEIGKGKPPEHTRWKRGQSGNPKGRPKTTKSGQTDVAEVLGKPLTVKQAGTARQMTPFEVGVRQLVKRALNEDNLKAALEFVRLCERYGIIAPPPPPDRGSPVLVVPKTWDWNEWLQMFDEHGPPPWPGERSGLPDEHGVDPTQQEQ